MELANLITCARHAQFQLELRIGLDFGMWKWLDLKTKNAIDIFEISVMAW